MNIAQVNIRSINTSATLVEHMCRKQNIDTLCLSEVWNKTDKPQCLKTWNWTFRSRATKRGGGVAITTKEHIKVLEIKLTNTTHADIAAANIYADTSSFTLISAYVPPDNKDGIDEVMRVLKSLQGTNKPLILCGDLNARHPAWGDERENHLGHHLNSHLLANNLHVINNYRPTRENIVIDLTITNKQATQLIERWRVQPEVQLKTDHHLITMQIGIKKPDTKVQRWDLRNVDWEQWEKTTHEQFENWLEENRDHTEPSNINTSDLYESFKDTLNKCTDGIISKKTITKHSKGHWNAALEQQMKTTKTALRKFHRRRDTHNLNIYLKEKETLTLMEEDEQNKHWQAQLKSMDPRRPQGFWKTIKTHLNKNTKTVIQPLNLSKRRHSHHRRRHCTSSYRDLRP
ncbi:uncharacterized protein [Branchiostoma lanceolatum]|uniref:uncharacterized protein n=1 Tax=Branchiostoma lanceolatum TaxID=7740 RepID=UPI003455C4A4